jgi:hypothetical protein
MAFNDPNNDGVVSLQREVGQNIIVVTVFAMQIWCWTFLIILFPYIFSIFFDLFSNNLRTKSSFTESFLGS